MNSGTAVIETDSGLLIPQSAAHAPVDRDGRRRVVITNDDRMRVKRAIKLLNAAGVSVLFRCAQEKAPPPGVPMPCGDMMAPEGFDTHDPGFGCRCSRLHLEP